MSWTDERIETLRKMWDSGLTATQIAEELGGVSRNAVIGKAHRLGLPSRPSPVKTSEAKAAAAAPAASPAGSPAASDAESAAPARPEAPVRRSVGPGGFLRQNPGEQSAPTTPAPPRRLVPAKPSDAIAGKTSLLDLNDRICKWPLGHPGEPDFHFCGEKVNPGFPYCVPHCGHAYQAQLPRRDRRPPPPLPFGGPRVR
jgi:GcrA cell cycle regulator